MDPFEPTVLATAAHFLSHPSSGGNGEEALDLYASMCHIDIPQTATINFQCCFRVFHTRAPQMINSSG